VTARRHSAKASGFSLIELLMAMAVFSFMLLIISAGFIGIVHINQSTTASRNTQQNARIVIETIERQLRSASVVYVQMVPATPPLIPANTQGRLCLMTESTYLEYVVQGDNLTVGPVASLAACDAAAAPYIGTTSQLNDSGVKVVRFVPTTTAIVGQNGGLASVELSMVGAGITLPELNSTYTACNPGPGSQFCSVTTLATTAALRGGADK